jgi:hypothetical protein
MLRPRRVFSVTKAQQLISTACNLQHKLCFAHEYSLVSPTKKDVLVAYIMTPKGEKRKSKSRETREG